MSRPRILVVGGGVIGVSCAYALAKAGAHVHLLERDAIGSGASGGNAGTVAVGHPPLNRRGRLRQFCSRYWTKEVLFTSHPVGIQACGSGSETSLVIVRMSM
ncbi:MAG: hypothetical protein Ct9H300mP15_16490 [Gemmatimonadota bacterium]|nr:MAG: hypothetical protein Ct9H300mP15_16490 [Gemmatimonadota bacterium]